MRVLCGGQVVEDYDYNRVHEMFAILGTKEARDNGDVEGFGYRYDDEANSVDTPTLANTLPGIAASSSKRVSFKPMSGLLSQSKWLPIRYCPVTIELELVSNAADPIVAATGAFVSTTSVDWEIEDVQLKADLCTLDNAVDNQIADHLLSGKPLPINFQTYISQSQILAAAQSSNFSVNVSRAVTRLARVFIGLGGPENPTAPDVRSKPWNTFFNPMDGDHTPARELEYQVQIGSKLFPEYPVQSSSEAFAQLNKAVMDVKHPHSHTLSIKAKQYIKDKFIICAQTSKLAHAGFTGLNTRSGDLMTIKAKLVGGASASPTAHHPTEIFIALESDQILEIRDTGVQVFD